MINRTSIFLFTLFVAFALVACTGGNATTPEPQASATLPAGQTEPAPETQAATSEATAPAVTDLPPTEPAATDSPTEEPAPPMTVEPTVLCPNVARPALILSVGPGFEAHDPLTGERCPLPLPETLGYLQPAGDRLYFEQFDHEGGNSIVARLNQDSAIETLEGTRAEGDVHYLMRFAVAADESQLAWTAMHPQDDPNDTALLGSMWVGASDGGEPVTILEDQVGGDLRIVTPIRFSADGAMLFFTWEPIGLGGMWSGFNGRFDNIYRVPVTGGQPEKVFDCADRETFLCIGDFQDDGTVAYIDNELVIHVMRPDGVEQATLPMASDYAGYPTFSPTGDMFYSEAMLPENEEDVPMPLPGTVSRVAAPYTGTPVVVAVGDGLLVSADKRPFLDAEHLVVSHLADGMWGTALLSTTGEITPLEPWPNAYLAAVWP